MKCMLCKVRMVLSTVCKHSLEIEIVFSSEQTDILIKKTVLDTTSCSVHWWLSISNHPKIRCICVSKSFNTNNFLAMNSFELKPKMSGFEKINWISKVMLTNISHFKLIKLENCLKSVKTQMQQKHYE